MSPDIGFLLTVVTHMHGKGCAPQVRKKERRDVLLASLLLQYSALYGMMFLGYRRDTFYVFIPKPTESSHIRFIAPFLVLCYKLP